MLFESWIVIISSPSEAGKQQWDKIKINILFRIHNIEIRI